MKGNRRLSSYCPYRCGGLFLALPVAYTIVFLGLRNAEAGFLKAVEQIEAKPLPLTSKVAVDKE